MKKNSNWNRVGKLTKISDDKYKYALIVSNDSYKTIYFPKIRKATNEEILEHLKTEFLKNNDLVVGEEYVFQSKNNCKYVGNFSEFKLGIKDVNTGEFSKHTRDWFIEYPNEKYQLMIRSKPYGTFNPDVKITKVDKKPDIEINGYKGEFFDDYIKFGCYEISLVSFNYTIEYIKRMRSHYEMNDIRDNKRIETIEFGEGGFITIEELLKINKYYENK